MDIEVSDMPISELTATAYGIYRRSVGFLIAFILLSWSFAYCLADSMIRSHQVAVVLNTAGLIWMVWMIYDSASRAKEWKHIHNRALFLEVLLGE